MLNKKWLVLSLVIVLSSFCSVSAKVSLSDLVVPKDPAYRVGISDIPENRYVETIQDKENIIEKNLQKQVKMNQVEGNDVSYSELDIKRLSKEVSADLEFEEQDMVADLSLLWQGAAMQSDTINFALYKLANPDKDKPDKGTVRKMLQTIASMSTVAGAAAGNALLAGTSLISGNVLGIMSQDTKALNYKYTRVSDADMIILIRKVEDLQQNAVNLYYDYMSAKKQLDMTTKLTQDRKERFELAQQNNAPKEIVVVTDAYFRSALDRQKTARSEFLSKRAALEQFVGNETFTQFEQELNNRQFAQITGLDQNSEAYNQTIQATESYSNNLNNKTASIESVPYYNSDTPQLRTSENDEDISNNPFAQVALADENQTTQKQKKQKVDRYSTKGLIFIHNNQPTTSQSLVNEVKSEDSSKAKKDKKVKETKKKSNKNPKKVNTNKTSKVKESSVKEVEVNQTPNVQSPQIELQNLQNKSVDFNGVKLLPLDEIKKPELTPHGYSIFSN